MSVILYSKDEVYQQMADAYEGLKVLLFQLHEEERDHIFYKSLRRIYFANVATFLCQYHDDTPLSKEELQAIDPFLELKGRYDMTREKISLLRQFLDAWSRLQYNLTTNDGEEYRGMQAYQFIEELAIQFSRAVARREDKEQQEAA